MLDNERAELGRKAGNGDLQAALKLVGLLLRTTEANVISDGPEIFRIRHRANGDFYNGRYFTSKGKAWNRLSSVMSSLSYWWKTTRARYRTAIDQYKDCDLVRYVTLEVSAEDVITLCKNKWGDGK